MPVTLPDLGRFKNMQIDSGKRREQSQFQYVLHPVYTAGCAQKQAPVLSNYCDVWRLAKYRSADL